MSARSLEVDYRTDGSYGCSTLDLRSSTQVRAPSRILSDRVASRHIDLGLPKQSLQSKGESEYYGIRECHRLGSRDRMEADRPF